MKTTENTALLDHKRKVDADRRAAALERQRQDTLRRITPGTATPLSIRQQVQR